MKKEQVIKENLDLESFIVFDPLQDQKLKKEELVLREDLKTNSLNTYKTICLNCETQYTKEKFLFSFCPNCKGTNLKDIEVLK